MLMDGRYELLRKSNLFKNNNSGMDKLLRNPKVVDAVNSIDFPKLELILLSNDRFCNKYKIQLLQNKRTVDAINATDIEKMELLLRIEDKIAASLIGKLLQSKKLIKTFNSIDKEKLSIILEKGKFHSHKLIVGERIGIDSKKIINPTDSRYNALNKGELKLLKENLQKMYPMKFGDIKKLKGEEKHNTKTDRILMDILENSKMMKGINLIDFEKFKLLIESCKKGSCCVLMWLMGHRNASVAINLIQIEKLDTLLMCDKIYTDYVMAEILKDKNTVDGINSVDIERIKALNNIGKLDGFSIITILENPNYIQSIKSMDMKELTLLLNDRKLFMELQKRDNSSREGVIGVLLNDDGYYFNMRRRLNDGSNPVDIEVVNSMDVEKFLLMIECELFDFLTIMMVIENQPRIDLIKSIDIEKLKLILNMKNIKGFHILRKVDDSIPIDDHEKCERIMKEFYRKFVVNLLLHITSVAVINDMEANVLSLLTNGNASGWLIRIIFQNPNFYQELKSINFEKLKLMINKLQDIHFLEILQNPYCIIGINSIEIQKLTLLLANDSFNDPLIVTLLRYEAVVFFIISIEIEKFELFLNQGTLLGYIIFKLFGNKNFERFDKLEVLLKSEQHCNGTFERLVRWRNAFDIIDRMETNRFKILLHQLDKSSLEKILSNKKHVKMLNSMKIENLKLLCQVFDTKTMLNIIQSHDAFNAMNLIDVRKLKLMYTSRKLHSTLTPRLLENSQIVGLINTIDFEEFTNLLKNGYKLFEHIFVQLLTEKGPEFTERVKIIFESSKDHCINFMIKILKSYDALDAIKTLDTEKLRIFLSKSLNRDFEKFKCSVAEKAEMFENVLHNQYSPFCELDYEIILKENDVLELFKNALTIRTINLISGKKIGLLIQNDLTDLIEQPIFANRIIQLDFKLLELLIDHILLYEFSLDQRTVDGLRMLDFQKLHFLIKTSALKTRSNSREDFVDAMEEIIQNRIVCAAINEMDFEKYKILIRHWKNDFESLGKILDNCKTYYLINSLSNEKLKTMVKMTTCDNFIAISKVFDGNRGNVGRNLNFAIALYMAGDIGRIGDSFIRDNDAVYAAIRRKFPPNFEEIKLILYPSQRLCKKGPVATLNDLCIETIIRKCTCMDVD